MGLENNNGYRWLTEASGVFLDRDYLVEGEDLDQRVDVIVNTAERILNKPGFASAFKENIKKGWYSLSTPIWSNFGTDRGLPISCVTGDTWINTKINGGKQAKDIVIGDEVLTHKGRYRKVTNIIKTENRSGIYKLKVSTRMTNLFLTGDHLVLTNLGWVRADELDASKHLVATNREMEFEQSNKTIDLREFVKYEFLEKDGRLFKSGKKSVRKDRRVDIVSYFSAPFSDVVVDKDLAWALGLWFAEGSICINEKKNPNGIRITVGVDEKHIVEKWLSVILDKFGIEGGFYESEVIRKGKCNKWINANVNSSILGRFFATFGKGCKHKTIPDWILSLPKEILNCFLEGLLAGDGTIRRCGSVKLTLANPKMLLQVYQIGLKLGLEMSLQMQDKPGKMSTTKHVYTLLFRKTNLSVARFSGRASVPFSDGLSYCPIRHIEETDLVADVYDFTVEEDHSFSASGVILHNCFGSYIVDKSESIAYTWSEVFMMTKHGGGTSATFNNLRHRGAKIRRNGESSGAVHFMQAWDMLINVVSQGKCYVEGTEILTDSGFKDFREVTKKDKIAQLDEFNSVDFTSQYQMVVEDFDGDLVCLSGKKSKDSVSIKVTPNHRMVVSRLKMEDRKRYWSKETEIVLAKDLKLHRDNRLILSGWAGEGKGLTDEDRLRIAFQADGIKDGPNRMIRFHFKKQRKIIRLKEILEKLGITYEVYNNPGGSVDINFPYIPSIKKNEFSEWVSLSSINGIWAREFVDELAKWDGTEKKNGTVVYSSTIKSNVDLVQAIASLADKKTRTWCRESYENRQDLYSVCISEGSYRSGDAVKITHEYYKGKVYCAVVPKGRLIVRYNGRVMVCGNTRRGNFAAYLNIDHPDVEEFLTIRHEGSSIQDLSFGLCVPDYWMKEMIAGDANKRKLWAKVLESRANIGFPYIFFVDTANKNAPDCYRDSGSLITHSNLCTEIMLPDNEEESFVCDLSSMNDLYYDEWKDTNAVELLVYFLDAVMTEFIEKAKGIKFMERAVRFAERHRALGIGQLGWHSCLQSRMIPWESMEAKRLNAEVSKTIRNQAYAASAKMAQEYGEPEVCEGYGRRHATLLAIAPTKSSAFILGQVSEGIEPHRANYYIKDLQKGKFTVKNEQLRSLLSQKGFDTEEIWSSILKAGGSVQHLECLDDYEKSVFKTFAEISQREIIIQAAQRQQYIDQGQSLNIMIHPSVPVKDVNSLIIEAWESGIKSLYYQISVNAAQTFSRNILACSACES